MAFLPDHSRWWKVGRVSIVASAARDSNFELVWKYAGLVLGFSDRRDFWRKQCLVLFCVGVGCKHLCGRRGEYLSLFPIGAFSLHVLGGVFPTLSSTSLQNLNCTRAHTQLQSLSHDHRTCLRTPPSLRHTSVAETASDRAFNSLLGPDKTNNIFAHPQGSAPGVRSCDHTTCVPHEVHAHVTTRHALQTGKHL